MNWFTRHWWDYGLPYVHTWPGQTPSRHTNKHSKARKARFKARHKA